MENPTVGKSSRSVDRMADTNKITIVDPIWGQRVANWITITETDTDGHVIYGPFDSQEYALIWAKQLINASIEPVYVPAYNRG
jgi:hypothetical protein